MLVGRLGITTDINLVNQLLYEDNARILLLSEEQLQLPNDRIVPATILLPPYPCVMATLDNDLVKARDEYMVYLMSKEVDMYICTVIAAIMRGMNIVIYLGHDETEMKFSRWLEEYIAITYGIIMDSDHSYYAYDQRYDGVILGKLYVYDLISHDELFMRYPYNLELPKYTIPKLVMEIAPYVQYPSEQSYVEYFERHKKLIKENNNQPLITPLMRGGIQ